MRLKVVLCVIVLAIQPVQLVRAADWEREKRMANQIIDAILDGDPVMLEAGGREFLSIYTEADESTRAVIVMHGRGFHPDWVDTVQPLRVGLVEYGWNTLSIQMPVLEKEAKYYDYVPVFDESVPRIEAAIDYLKQQGNQEIVLIAHSCSVHMSMHYIDQHGDKRIDGYVGIGMGATDYKQPMAKTFPLEKLSVPVLDIFGADDYPAVHRLAPGRWAKINEAGNPASKQIIVEGANHYFTDKGNELLENVGSWLQKNYD